MYVCRNAELYACFDSLKAIQCPIKIERVTQRHAPPALGKNHKFPGLLQIQRNKNMECTPTRPDERA